MPYTYRTKRPPVCRNTYNPSIKPKTESGKEQRNGNDVFFSDTLAVTDSNTSTANAWAHYEVSQGTNKER